MRKVIGQFKGIFHSLPNLRDFGFEKWSPKTGQFFRRF